MKNVIKPSEAVYIDQEITIGSHDPHNRSLSDDNAQKNDAQYHDDNQADIDLDTLQQDDGDVNTLHGSLEDVNDTLQAHTFATSTDTSKKLAINNRAHSGVENDFDDSLKFLSDDERNNDYKTTDEMPNDLPSDEYKETNFAEINPTSSMVSQTIDSDSPVDNDVHEDIPLPSSGHAITPDSSADASMSTIATPTANQPSATSSPTSLSTVEYTLSKLERKIDDIHVSLTTLQESVSNSSDSTIDSEWLTKLSSIEQSLEASDSAKNSGYEDGYKAGYQEAMDKGMDEIKNVIHKIRKISGTLLSRKKEIINESQDTIIDIIVLIAKKIVKQISKQNKEVIIANVKDALSKVKQHSNITIRINPTDLAANEKMLNTISHEIARDSEIEFVEDTTIDNGGVYIETESGSVNAQISAQLLEIENSIRDMR